MTRTRRAVETTINGDSDELHGATKRGLFTLADHVDDLIKEVESLRRTVQVVGTGIVMALVSAVLSFLLR